MVENIVPFFCFIFFFFVLSLVDTVPIRISARQHHILYNIACFVLICFAGCRWSSWEKGYDTDIFDYDTYQIVYKESPALDSFIRDYKEAPLEVKQMDVGYVLWNSLAHAILGDNYNLFLLLTNAIVVTILLAVFKRMSAKRGLFFIIFFYAARLYLQYNFTLVRQAIAIVIIWYALNYLINGNLRKYIFSVIFASIFHFSAIICVFFPLINKLRINVYVYFILLLAAIIFSLTGMTSEIIELILNMIFNALGLPITNRLSIYLNLEGGANVLNFIEAIPFFYIAISNRKQLLSTYEGKLYYNMLFCFVLLTACFMTFSFFTRLWQYMIICYIYLISYIFKYNQKQYLYLVNVLLLYCLLYSVRYIMMWFYHVPYSCFLFHL